MLDDWAAYTAISTAPRMMQGRQVICPGKGTRTRACAPSRGEKPREGQLLLEVARRGESFPLREGPTKAYPKQQLGKHAELLGSERAFFGRLRSTTARP